MENKNFLAAMGLIVGFLLVWSFVVVPRFTPKPVPGAAPVQVLDTPGLPEKQEITSAHMRMGQPIVDKDMVLRDESNEIVLTPKGGAVKNWRLKPKNYEVDMVLNPEADVLPLATFPEARYNIAVKDRTAQMQATLDNGLRVTKVLSLSPTGHLHRLSIKFQNPTARTIEVSKWTLGWGPGLGTDPGEMKENPGIIRAIVLGKLKVKKLKAGQTDDMGRFAAVDNRYYLAAFLPLKEHPVQLSVEGAKEHTQLSLVDSLKVGPGQSEEVIYDLYVGPKGYTQLKTYKRDLEESVDFGFFAALGKWVLNALYFLKSKTGNFGVAIILLTIGIQILMLPLSLKSFKATMAMKKMQPRIAELQARFKGDPKRLNIEMMNLYKNSKTNPFGGCLPMLLQMPIFLALFNALRNAQELRGAPFIGWIHDLSAPDVLFQVGSFPLHALPLIMGGAMFVQQRMSGAVSDPTQRQMMTLMPVMFTVMFYGFPSGLVLYWLTNNLMTMASQWGFQRIHRDDPQVIETTIVK